MKYTEIDGEDINNFKAPPKKFRIILYDAYTFIHYFINDYTNASLAKKRAKKIVDNDSDMFYHTSVYDESGSVIVKYGTYS
ncbi:hypothetical protein D4R87_01425 [bacterium]|nr:MAG: hypothetical protein D4R87_01425 [bacterium]